MSGPRTLQICFLVGQTSHPQAVIDDLWNRAVAAVDPALWQVHGTAVYLRGGGTDAVTAANGLHLVALEDTGRGRLAGLAAAAANKPGPIGIVGRLLRDNLDSRHVSGTLARRKDLVGTFCSSAVVVAADVAADRAVWKLRKRSGAALLHGPVAMVHAIRQLAVG